MPKARASGNKINPKRRDKYGNFILYPQVGCQVRTPRPPPHTLDYLDVDYIQSQRIVSLPRNTRFNLKSPV